jgi:hypothetical protein
MWWGFFAIALVSAVANSALTAKAQPSCPPGSYVPRCFRTLPEGGSERIPLDSNVDPRSRSGRTGPTEHVSAARVGGHSAGAGSHGGWSGGHGGGGGNGGGGNGGGGGGH